MDKRKELLKDFLEWFDEGLPVLKGHDELIKEYLEYSEVSILIEPPVKPACVNCKHLNIENGDLLKDRVELCQNSKIRLYNLTNCDIDIHSWGCTYFESKSV